MNKNIKPLLAIAVAILVGCKEKENPEDNSNGSILVSSITLNPTTLSLEEGETATLTAEVKPDNATNKNIIWTSKDPSVATVYEGEVAAIKAGSTVIVAKSEDGEKTASCEITVNPNIAPSVTIGATNTSAISVVLLGKANLGPSVASDLKMGILWSRNSGVLPSNSSKIEASNMDGDYLYSVNVTSLDPATTYYYRSYITQNGQDTYGETKEFSTKDLSSMLLTLDAFSISPVSSTLNGMVDLTDVQYTTKTLGFYFGKKSTSISEQYIIEDEGGKLLYNIATLSPDTEYFFQSFAILDGKEYKESVKSFTTKDLKSMLETLDATEVSPTSAILNAKLNLQDVQYANIDYGFYWGNSKDSQETVLKGGSIADNLFASKLEGLSHKTQYWYKCYVTLDGTPYLGEAKSLTTEVVPVKSISLDKSSHVFKNIGDAIELTPTILPEDATDKRISWHSSDESVVKVDNTGRVTAMGNGEAVISVTTVDQEKTANCSISVVQQVTSITLNTTSLTLNEGATETLMATVMPENAIDKTVKWSSSDDKVVSVDSNGKISAISKGTATITATANDDSGASASCSVEVKRLVTSITLDKTLISLYPGQNESIAASVLPESASNKTVVWSSSNSSVASVSSVGLVVGVAPGTASISAVAVDGSGVFGECNVEVKQYVTGISLEKSSTTLYVGESETLEYTITPSNASNKSVTWVSSDDSVASVDIGGTVIALSKGTATITVMTNDGSNLNASCIVTVPITYVAVDLGLSVKWATFNLGASSPEEYGGYYAWAETETKDTYTWSNYRYGSGSWKLKKYNSSSTYGSVVDNKTSLDLSDDAARVIIGEPWRMPTKKELEELAGCNCSWEKLNGKYGYKITGKKSGYTDKWIFLPAAGWQSSDKGLRNAGSNGYYWSRESVGKSTPYYAWCFYFLKTSNDFSTCDRAEGRTIRAVCPK